MANNPDRAVPLKLILDEFNSASIRCDQRLKRTEAILHLDHISSPRPDSLSFYSGDDPEVIKALGPCTVICKPGLEKHNSKANFILCEDPHLAFFHAAQLFFPERNNEGIHPTAQIHPEAKIHSSAEIAAFAVVGNCSIGPNCRIGAHVTIFDNTIIEEDVEIEANSCIGATGVFWAWTKNGGKIKLPQLGGTRLEKGSFLGTDVTVVRGSFSNETTTIGQDCNIAHGSKIGHSCILEKHVHLANNISLGGKVHLGEACFLGSGAVVRPGVSVAANTTIGAGAVVVKNVEDEGLTMAGVPAKPLAQQDKRSGVPARPE